MFLTCQMDKWSFFEEFKLQRNCEINSSRQNVFWVSWNDIWASIFLPMKNSIKLKSPLKTSKVYLWRILWKGDFPCSSLKILSKVKASLPKKFHMFTLSIKKSPFFMLTPEEFHWSLTWGGGGGGGGAGVKCNCPFYMLHDEGAAEYPETLKVDTWKLSHQSLRIRIST